MLFHISTKCWSEERITVMMRERVEVIRKEAKEALKRTKKNNQRK